jgi:hypothetical protein
MPSSTCYRLSTLPNAPTTSLRLDMLEARVIPL